MKLYSKFMDCQIEARIAVDRSGLPLLVLVEGPYKGFLESSEAATEYEIVNATPSERKLLAGCYSDVREYSSKKVPESWRRNEVPHLTLTAYHEAGHAVVRYHVHLPFKHVTIVPKDNYLGHIEVGKLPEGFHPDSYVDERTERDIERHILALAGGDAATSLLTGRHYLDEGRVRLGKGEAAGKLRLAR